MMEVKLEDGREQGKIQKFRKGGLVNNEVSFHLQLGFINICSY